MKGKGLKLHQKRAMPLNFEKTLPGRWKTVICSMVYTLIIKILLGQKW